MAATERIVFQPYVQGKRGTVAAAPAIACRTLGEAQRRADKAMAGGGKVIGVHIVRVMADEEAGDYGDPDFVVTMGMVPTVGF